ncbi:MAG: hypothetical protein AAGF12_00510 [Myxococcota bacterium]
MSDDRKSSGSKVILELSEDEALVLLGFLTRLNKDSPPELFADQAEQRALWDLEASLEGHLVATVRADYDQLLADARLRVRDSE